jgi:hypothetical protein
MASSPNTANVFSTNGIQQAPSAGGHSGPQLSPGQDLPRPTYGLPLDSTVVRARLPIDEQKEQGWRYYGYPAFATWTASSKDSFVIRRFSKLNSRILLRLQDEIAHLEEMLDNIDNHCITRFEKIDNGTFRDDKVNDRRQVLDQLTLKLKFFSESSIHREGMLCSYLQDIAESSSDKPRVFPLANLMPSQTNTLLPTHQSEIKSQHTVMRSKTSRPGSSTTILWPSIHKKQDTLRRAAT